MDLLKGTGTNRHKLAPVPGEKNPQEKQQKHRTSAVGVSLACPLAKERSEHVHICALDSCAVVSRAHLGRCLAEIDHKGPLTSRS